MKDELLKIKYYVAAVAVALGVFTWAGLTGTRLLGDDNESVENKQGLYGGSGRTGGRGYYRSYHK